MFTRNFGFWQAILGLSQYAFIVKMINFPDTEVYCCRGYCIDLLRQLAETCNFTYNLHLSFEDYGALERNNLTGKQEWTGLIGELVGESISTKLLGYFEILFHLR